MGFQVALQKRQFFRGKLLRAAVVQNGEVRLAIVEAIAQPPPGVLQEQAFRFRRPDVMVPWNGIQRKALVGPQQPFRLRPLRRRTGVVQALDRVSGRHHKRRVFGGGLPPCFFVDAGDRFPRPVAQNGEAERPLVRRKPAANQRAQNRRNKQNPGTGYAIPESASRLATASF